MSRPKPLLSSSYSAYNEHDSILTPRTPHSRAGRAEEGRGRPALEIDSDLAETEFDTDGEYELDPGMVQQRAPLLASSADASFPHRRPTPGSEKHEKAQKISWRVVRERAPLITGIASVILLLFLLLMSEVTPEALHTYLHGQPLPYIPSPSNASTMHMMLNYSGYDSFPLEPLAYREECAAFQASMKGPMGTYWYIPPGGPADVPHKEDPKICSSSITYMLDGYVGLAADLALMAQAAGLAREQNRTFLVDDSNWNRGKWVDHFQDVRVLQPGPEPGCLAPPPEELVACPRTARHWVINSRTALFHFGHGFMNEFEDPYARELRRHKPIFTRASHSFAHTLRPSAPNAALIRAARLEVGGSYVGVHVRRGDRKAEAWRYRGGYVPLGEYVDAVQEVRGRIDSLVEEEGMKVWIASDDPDARLELTELLSSPSESTKKSVQVLTLATSKAAELRELASDDAYVQAHFVDLEEEARIRATRGAIVDFALVSGMWAWDSDGEGEVEAPNDEEAGTKLEAVVCTMSSNFCKLSAVGLGWTRAFGFAAGDPNRKMTMDDAKKRWVEIDNRGEIDPVWRAFELF